MEETMPVRIRRLLLILWICVLWLVTGCVARTLREAQDHFNKAAEIETRAIDRSLLSDNPEANPSDALAALNEYRLAYSVATQLIKEQSSSLKQENLLGVTYILKAMALWRIAGLE